MDNHFIKFLPLYIFLIQCRCDSNTTNGIKWFMGVMPEDSSVADRLVRLLLKSKKSADMIKNNARLAGCNNTINGALISDNTPVLGLDNHSHTLAHFASKTPEKEIPAEIINFTKNNQGSNDSAPIYLLFVLSPSDYLNKNLTDEPQYENLNNMFNNNNNKFNEMFFDLTNAPKMFDIFTKRYIPSFPSMKHKEIMFHKFVHNLNIINKLNKKRNDTSSVVYGVTLYAGMDDTDKQLMSTNIGETALTNDNYEGKEFAKPIYDEKGAPEVFERLITSYSLRIPSSEFQKAFRNFGDNLKLVSKYHLDPEFVDVIPISPIYIKSPPEFQRHVNHIVNLKMEDTDIPDVEMKRYEEPYSGTSRTSKSVGHAAPNKLISRSFPPEKTKMDAFKDNSNDEHILIAEVL